MIQTHPGVRANESGQDGDGGASQSAPKQHNLGVQTSEQILMNPEGNLMIFA